MLWCFALNPNRGPSFRDKVRGTSLQARQRGPSNKSRQTRQRGPSTKSRGRRLKARQRGPAFPPHRLPPRGPRPAPKLHAHARLVIPVCLCQCLLSIRTCALGRQCLGTTTSQTELPARGRRLQARQRGPACPPPRLPPRGPRTWQSRMPDSQFRFVPIFTFPFVHVPLAGSASAQGPASQAEVVARGRRRQARRRGPARRPSGRPPRGPRTWQCPTPPATPPQRVRVCQR